jgi:predicted HTH transcriptional regulator
MLVIRTDDRTNYLKTLHLCDILTGEIPSDGAHATLEQTKPLIDYIADIVETKLKAVLQLIRGEIKELIEAKDDTKIPVKENTTKSGQKKVVRKSGQKRWSEVLNLIKENPSISRKELSEKLDINPSAIQKHIQKLKSEGLIERMGGDKGGYWKILK